MIRGLFILIFLFQNLGVSVSSQDLPVPDGFKISPLLRSTHFVSDVNESLKLYRDILGLEIRVDRILENKLSNNVLGTKNKRVRAVVLKSGDLFNGGVGLFQFLDETNNVQNRKEAYAKPGDAVLVFITNDIFGIYEKVKKENHTIASEPMILFPVEGKEAQDYEMLFFDRDGIGVNLIQRSLIRRN